MRPAGVIGRVEAELAAFVLPRAEALSAVGPELAPLAGAARSIVLDGGKRLRPCFAYWGWQAAGAGTDEAALVVAAASLELLHACALVHDDVMDGSGTRRGRPAGHAVFAQLHRDSGWSGNPESFGTAAAILLGDLLLSWADAMFASAALDPAMLGAARRVFDEMRQQLLAGQYLDLLLQARGEFSADDALRVAGLKSGRYTVEGPLQLGAAAAGAGPATVAALSAYGLPLGEAFQLRDDVLGVFGDPGETGKPAGDDLREGKGTLLVAFAMERADAAQAAALRRGLGARGLDDPAVAALREVIVVTGALERVERRIGERCAEARAAARAGGIAPEATDALDALALAATRRSA